MSVRTIKSKSGEVAGYQALSGAGRGPGSSRYFSIAEHGDQALRKAQALSAELKASRPRRVYPPRLRNSAGVPGLRFELRPSTAVDGAPLLYAVATWWKKDPRGRRGKPGYASASTRVHGLLGAVARVREKREAATGAPMNLTDRQLARRMKRALDQS